MSERESNFLKILRNYLIGFGLTVILGSISFYFNTNNRLNNLETDVSKKADKEVINTKLDNITKSLDNLTIRFEQQKINNGYGSSFNNIKNAQ